MKYALFLIAGAFVLGSSLLWSQREIPGTDTEFQKTAPKVFQSPTSQSEEAVEVMSEPEEGEQILPELKGVVVEESEGQVTELTPGVTIAGPLFLRDPLVTDALAGYVGRPLTVGDLDRLCFLLALMSRKMDHPLVSAVIPPQDISSGILRIRVQEAKVGEVRVEGNKWFSDDLFLREMRFKSGDRVRSSLLKEDIDWINRNSFRNSAAVFSPGEEPGTTDLVLQTQDRFPVTFYVGFEDTGNDTTGDERWLTGINWGNVGGWGHSLNYQFTTSPNTHDSITHSGSYNIPLPWRHTLTLFGNYSDSNPVLASPFSQDSTSWQAGVRYIAPLPEIGPWSHEAYAGFDFKQSNSHLVFGGTTVFNRTSDVNQFVLGYDGSAEDEWGRTRFYNSVFLSPGGWSDGNKDSVFIATRVGSGADYVYAKLGVDRQTRLWGDFLWNFSIEGQVSSRNLIGSEQFSLGGYSSVRGYEESEGTGDSGWRISNEVVTPAVSPLSILSLVSPEKATDQLQFLFFWDYGVAHPHAPTAGQDNNVILSSIGPGLRYQVDRYLSVRFDYGFQLTDSGASDGRRNDRAHLGVTVSY